MSLSQQLAEYISACFTGLWLQSHEHEDALREIAQMCSDQDWRLATWDVDQGLQIPGAEMLARHGLHVLVDLHQDVWGGPFAEHGAPDWATLGPGTGREPGGSWLLGYLNPPVYRSFQALWENRRVPATGLGLQDHLARAWAFLARRLASVDGPTKGKIQRPSDAKEVESIAFVQCAGSRDENHLPYCSGVCCLVTMKHAI